MATAVLMPKQGNSVESCIIVEWKKHKGEAIDQGDVLCEVETDKAVMEVESPVAGTVLELFFQAGDVVPVQVNIAAVGAPGEDVSALRPEGATAPGPATTPPDAASGLALAAPVLPASQTPRGDQAAAISPRAALGRGQGLGAERPGSKRTGQRSARADYRAGCRSRLGSPTPAEPGGQSHGGTRRISGAHPRQRTGRTCHGARPDIGCGGSATGSPRRTQCSAKQPRSGECPHDPCEGGPQGDCRAYAELLANDGSVNPQRRGRCTRVVGLPETAQSQ